MFNCARCSHVGLALILSIVPALLSGASVQNSMVTKWAPPGSGCTVPVAASSFVTTDSKVWLYFETTVVSSDQLTAQWVQPDGNVYTPATVGWSNNTGNYCFSQSFLDISNFSGPLLGSWQVNVLLNGSPLIPALQFRVEAPGGTSATPHIDRITPTTVPIGVNNTFDIYGSGFKQGFSGRLRVGSGSQVRIDPGAQAIFQDSGHVQLIVQVGATRDPTTTFSLQVLNPPPGNEPSNEFQGLTAQAGGGSASPTVRWTSQPRDPFQNGDTLNGGWSISGGSRATSSHVHMDMDQARVLTGNRQYGTPYDQAGADGNYSQSFRPTDTNYFGTLSNGSTVYFAVHATDSNGTDYYSLPVQSKVAAVIITNSNVKRWKYDSSVNSDLSGFTVFLERETMTPYNQYRVIISDEAQSLFSSFMGMDTAHMALVLPKQVWVDHQSYRQQISLYAPDKSFSGWYDPLWWSDVFTPSSNSSTVGSILINALGLIPMEYPVAGSIAGIQVAAGILNAVFNDDSITPDSTFQQRIDDDNAYTTRRFAIPRQYGGVKPPYAMRFVVSVDDSQGLPWFFVRGYNGSTRIGLQIVPNGSDYVLSRVVRR